eukprot:COSAG03_NODE_1791_length_3519_cov_1.446199_3_plen_202_part_00
MTSRSQLPSASCLATFSTITVASPGLANLSRAWASARRTTSSSLAPVSNKSRANHSVSLCLCRPSRGTSRQVSDCPTRCAFVSDTPRYHGRRTSDDGLARFSAHLTHELGICAATVSDAGRRSFPSTCATPRRSSAELSTAFLSQDPARSADEATHHTFHSFSLTLFFLEHRRVFSVRWFTEYSRVWGESRGSSSGILQLS